MAKTTMKEWQLKKALYRLAASLGFRPKSWKMIDILESLEEADRAD